MLIQLARDRLVGGAHDRVGLPLRESPGLGVDQRRSFLDKAIGVVDALRHAIVADREVQKAALGLRTPIAIGGHVDAAHGIRLVTLAPGLDADRDVAQGGLFLTIHGVSPSMGRRAAAICATDGAPIYDREQRATAIAAACGA